MKISRPWSIALSATIVAIVVIIVIVVLVVTDDDDGASDFGTISVDGSAVVTPLDLTEVPFCPAPGKFFSSLQTLEGNASTVKARGNAAVLADGQVLEVSLGGAMSLVGNVTIDGHVDVSRNGEIVATSSGNTVTARYTANLEIAWAADTSSGRAGFIHFSDDRKTVACRAGNTSVDVRDATSGDLIRTLAEVTDDGFGRWITSSAEGLFITGTTLIREYRSENVASVQTAPGSGNVHVTRDGARLAVGNVQYEQDSSYTWIEAAVRLPGHVMDINYNNRAATITDGVLQVVELPYVGSASQIQSVDAQGVSDASFSVRLRGFEMLLFAGNASGVSTYSAACV